MDINKVVLPGGPGLPREDGGGLVGCRQRRDRE